MAPPGMPHEQFIIALVAISAVFGLPFLGMVIWIIAHYSCAAFKTSREIALKRDMVARGYTVQEIVEVVSAKRGAKTKAKSPLSDVPPAKPVKHAAYTQ
jgi:hypothetical protein